MNGADEPPKPPYELHRATLEDLPKLKKLWQEEGLPGHELERHFTDFQVALTPQGELAGAIGVRIQKHHGLVHSEAFKDPQSGAELRPLLWQRILAVAKNNGLVRLWALPTTSFYREQGMMEIDDWTRAKLPEGFGSPLADWVTLKLREENQGAFSLEKEFEIFAQAQKSDTDRLMKQAQAIRVVAYTLLALAFLALGAVIVLILPQRWRRGR